MRITSTKMSIPKAVDYIYEKVEKGSMFSFCKVRSLDYSEEENKELARKYVIGSRTDMLINAILKSWNYHWCKFCKQYRHISEFPASKSKNHRLPCRICASKRVNAYNKTPKGKLGNNRRRKEYYQRNKEKCREKGKIRGKEITKELTDGYVASVMYYHLGVYSREFTKKEIEVYRNIIRLDRLIRKKLKEKI